MGTGSIQRVKRAEQGVYHPLTSSAEAKKVYIYNHAHPMGHYGLYRVRLIFPNIKHNVFRSKGQQIKLFR